jgi:hypothetical protein
MKELLVNKRNILEKRSWAPKRFVGIRKKLSNLSKDCNLTKALSVFEWITPDKNH